MAIQTRGRRQMIGRTRHPLWSPIGNLIVAGLKMVNSAFAVTGPMAG